MNYKITTDNLQQFISNVNNATNLMQLVFPCAEFRRDWMPRYEVMQYLGFGATQMNVIAKRYKLQKSVIGKRIFYNTRQLIEILNQAAKDS